MKDDWKRVDKNKTAQGVSDLRAAQALKENPRHIGRPYEFTALFNKEWHSGTNPEDRHSSFTHGVYADSVRRTDNKNHRLHFAKLAIQQKECYV